MLNSIDDLLLQLTEGEELIWRGGCLLALSVVVAVVILEIVVVVAIVVVATAVAVIVLVIVLLLFFLVLAIRMGGAGSDLALPKSVHESLVCMLAVSI